MKLTMGTGEREKRIPGFFILQELMYDYGDSATGLEDFMKCRNCVCSLKCAILDIELKCS